MENNLKKKLLKTQELIDTTQWARAIYALELVNIHTEDLSRHNVVKVYDDDSYGEFADGYEGPWWLDIYDNRIYRGYKGDKSHNYYFNFINDTEWLEAHWCLKNSHGDFTFTIILEYSSLDGVKVWVDIEDNITHESTGAESRTIEWLIRDVRFEDIRMGEETDDRYMLD